MLWRYCISINKFNTFSMLTIIAFNKNDIPQILYLGESSYIF